MYIHNLNSVRSERILNYPNEKHEMPMKEGAYS